MAAELSKYRHRRERHAGHEDFINHRRSEGIRLLDAARKAGARRFRPIMLTSVTTFVGLIPLMSTRSLKAQFLIPVAVSLAFGVMFATIVTLYLIPCSLLVGQDIRRGLDQLADWYLHPFRQQIEKQPERASDAR